MKLSARQIDRTANQIHAEAVPEDHPIVPELIRVYGEHTFFLDKDGLEIVEEAEPAVSPPTAQVVKLASWADARRTALAPHDPQPTDVLVDLDSEERDPTQ